MATRIYTVKGGDSLSIIARDVLGDLERWPEIAYMNSLEAPYLIVPGQVLVLPDNGEPLQVVVTGGQRAPVATPGAAVTKKAGFEFTPATVTVLLVAVAAVFLFLRENR